METNIFYISDKYILQFGQIFAITSRPASISVTSGNHPHKISPLQWRTENRKTTKRMTVAIFRYAIKCTHKMCILDQIGLERSARVN